MKSCRPPLFWKRKFEPTVIVTCVRWYLRFCLSLRDLEELMAERGTRTDRKAQMSERLSTGLPRARSDVSRCAHHLTL